MTSRPWIGRTRIGLLNTAFSASSSLIWAAVGLPDSRSLRRGCIVIPPMCVYRANSAVPRIYLFPFEGRLLCWNLHGDEEVACEKKVVKMTQRWCRVQLVGGHLALRIGPLPTYRRNILDSLLEVF